MSKNLSAIEEEFIEEPTEILEKKTIITIAIMSHGQDMPKVPFLNENVRILSYAGRSGSIGLAQPTTLEHINKEFEKYFLEYHRKIPTKGKKKYMQQLYTDFPNANKCQKIPDFKFEEDGRATPVSTFNFLEDRFFKEHKDEEGRIIPSTDQFDGTKQSYRGFAVKKMKQNGRNGKNSRNERFTTEDAESALTHRIYTPVIDKLYQFTDLIDPSVPEKYNFGIYVLDICNYDQKEEGHVNIKVGMDLMKSKAVFNREFLQEIIENNYVTTLDNICDYLDSLGFDIINIIDVACRTYHSREFAEKEQEHAEDDRGEDDRGEDDRGEDGEKERERLRSPTLRISPSRFARSSTSISEFLRNKYIDKGRGNKSKKHKSRKHKTRKHKTRKHKTRKHKSSIV